MTTPVPDPYLTDPCLPDPYLLLPLDGVRAIEASAGTGKTFTLATLVVRLVVERGLRLGEILAVTFTDAATQELRRRIRLRLLLAVELIERSPGEDATPEAMLTHAVIAAHLDSGRESVDALRRRLRTAADDIDLASIFTIHGFCARVLRDHALEAGQGFDAPELLASDAELREAIAADLWRSHGAVDDAAEDLLALWPQGPTALARDLSPLVRERVLRPGLAEIPADPTPRLHAAGESLANAFRAHGEHFRAALVDAIDAKVLHGGSYKVEWIQTLFAALKSWCDAGDAVAPFEHPKLAQLGLDTLLLRTSVKHAGRTPESPICAVVPPYLDALTALGEWQDARRVRLLHRLRDDAHLRIARHKQLARVQTYDDLIDRVADAVDGPHADALVAGLRAQYKIALVDEFQDTDPRQWRIFERLFGAASAAPALFVIGDPKQAIYGFRGGDVDTYLAAQAQAEAAPPLASNFRSRPSVLRAVSALYSQAGASGHPPFVDDRICFREVLPGGLRRDDHYLRGGEPAAALTLWRAPPPPPPRDPKAKPKNYRAGESRELATAACVAQIHQVLREARAGNATVEGRPVQPGDIAVLVRSHAEATRIRHALARVGIPAVAAGKQSLFATPEARDVHALLLAVLHGADDGRLRMALSTVLVGEDARQIDALDADADALRHWQRVALSWRERLQRGGPLALINDLCAEHAGRLLGLLDGERRLTNYLQLAELLQQAQAHALGLHGLVDWLERAIAAANADDGLSPDESRLLRLESDARRVQVVTLHKSKGLEYPLVFLPFIGIGGKPRDPGRHLTVGGEGGRSLHWKLLPSVSGWEAARQRWLDAQRAEDARLLYVGLTRARDALWLAGGKFYSHEQSPLAHMIDDPQALSNVLGSAIAIDDRPPPPDLAWLPPEEEGDVPPARIATRTLSSDWWVYSFTQLANAEAGADVSSKTTEPASGGQDEPDADDVATLDLDAFDPRFSGARFGVVLHDVLEHSDFARWVGWMPGMPAPEGQQLVIVERLRAGGYAAEDIEDGVTLLTELVGQTLTVPLPEGVRLVEVPSQARRAEIEFQFALAPTRVDALLALLHRHGLLTARHGFGARRQLEGLMTGLIDLTYQHEGRWYVLDYKSNRLPGYGPAQLAAAMDHSEYDLQALIYTLALHRWLRFRLGAGYDYERDFGGARYLFCRGLDATRGGSHGVPPGVSPGDSPSASPGVQAWRFDVALIEALDALFAGRAAGVAA